MATKKAAEKTKTEPDAPAGTPLADLWAEYLHCVEGQPGRAKQLAEEITARIEAL